MGGWDDRGYYEQEAAYDAMIYDAVENISDSGVQSYLGCNGDAIDARVLGSIKQARELINAGFHQPAVVVATTAIELIVRFFLIRPLIQAGFLSEEWASLLTEHIASGRTDKDRKLLPRILEEHHVDISAVLLEDGRELWQTVIAEVYPKRNRVVHLAEPATEANALLALECAERLRSDVVLPIAERMGFTLDVTGVWCRTKTKGENLTGSAYFTVRDPFARVWLLAHTVFSAGSLHGYRRRVRRSVEAEPSY